MISSMASMSSSSSATVRVEKATSEFLIGPDWTLNIDICDTINSSQMLAKDVVKAVKKRLQHKNPKVQLLALTTDMHVRDKILTLIGSWQEAFGGPGGRYPQYYMAYEDLRRPPDAAPIFTPPVTHPISRQPQPGYGMPSSSSTRLDEAMAADENISLSSLNSMHDVLDLLADMLKAVDPNDRLAIKDEVIIDLVEQCRANQRKLMQLLTTTGDEELLGQGLELNDSLQSVLARHDAIASGSALPSDVTNVTPRASEIHDSSPKSADVSVPNVTSNDTPSVPVFPAASRGFIDEEDEEEDDFAQLARRHSKSRIDVPQNTSIVQTDAVPSEAPSSPAMSNALVPINPPASARTKDQDIIDLLSITLSTTATSTDQTSQAPGNIPSMHIPGNIPSTSAGIAYSSEAYPGNPGLGFNNYIAPWAQPQPQPQSQPASQLRHPSPNQPQPQPQPQQLQSQPEVQSQPQHQYQYQYATQPALRPSNSQPQFSAYPPPPWAATPGYYSNQRPAYTYSAPRPSSTSNNPRPLQYEPINGEKVQVNSGQGSAGLNVGPKPFIPSYRLFEDLDVFGNADGRFQATSNASPSLSGSNNHSVVGGRK
ncbi:hypothetical protein DH2020_048004 [Rehmannia glutinosa]|uniref:TOM1-like protein n=1 Tax=Rehmannia glutinosa TaxID=99300 RepID=A0ABR0U6Y2_REHGL